MSRAYKLGIVDDIIDLGGTVNAAGMEKMTGADLEQLRQAARNGVVVSVDVNGKKTLGTVATHNKNAAALSGADLERYAGLQ